MLPSLVSASVYQLVVFCNTFLASLQVEASISWLYYADRLYQFPLGVFSLALGSAVLPSLSRFALRNEEAALRKQLEDSLRWITFVTIPAAVAMFVLAEPLVRAIYGGGRFQGSVPATAVALAAYSIGLWAVSIQSIVVRTFLAKKHTIAPALVSLLTVGTSVLLALALMGPPQVADQSGFVRLVAELQQRFELRTLGHVGIALATSISSYLSVFVLLLLLPRFGTGISVFALLRSILRSALASAPMAGVLVLLLKLSFGSVLTVCIAVPLGAVVYAATSLLLRSPELGEVLQTLGRVGARFRRRGA